MAMAGHDPNQLRMSLGDHLEELRHRILLGLIGPGLGLIVGLIFGKSLLALILVPYVEAQRASGFPVAAEALNVTETFGAYLKVSLLCGLVLGLPWFIWQLWQFVAAGLYDRERRLVAALVPGSAVLTVLGLAFMYMIMLPVMVAFFLQFSASIDMPEAGQSRWFTWMYEQLELPSLQVKSDGAAVPSPDSPSLARIPVLTEDPPSPEEGAAWIVGRTLRVQVGKQTVEFLALPTSIIAQRQRVTEWISLVLQLALAFVVAFQTPLVLVLVNRVRLVSLETLRKVRKYAVLVCFIVGALLTPADPVSQVLLAVPLYLLYEGGMVLCRLFNRQSPEEAA
jgi:Tat protein translocase TatC